jgi:hypothetical protein
MVVDEEGGREMDMETEMGSCGTLLVSRGPGDVVF